MIVITGATGNTGLKTAQFLLSTNEKIRVLGRSVEKLKVLERQGAEMRVGNQADVKFLSEAFQDAHAAYIMIPPQMDAPDFRTYYNRMGDVISKALHDSKINKIIFLSSLGAEHASGVGPIVGLHDVEQKLKIFKDRDIVFLRPGYFMENTLMHIPLIKSQNIVGNSTNPDAIITMVATRDIAARAAMLLRARNFKNHSILELFSQRISSREFTQIISRKIANINLNYVQFSENDIKDGFLRMGFSESVAESFIEMARAFNSGLINPIFTDHKEPTCSTKFEDFVSDVFIPAYKN